MSALQDDKPVFQVTKGGKKKAAKANDAPILQEGELGEGEMRLEADSSSGDDESTDN